MLVAMLAISEGIYVERFPKCHFSRPGPLRGRQNHVKTTVSYYRLEKKTGSAKATKQLQQQQLLAKRSWAPPSHSWQLKRKAAPAQAPPAPSAAAAAWGLLPNLRQKSQGFQGLKRRTKNPFPKGMMAKKNDDDQKNEEKKESLAKRDGDQKDDGKKEESLAKRNDQKMAEDKENRQTYVKMEVPKEDNRNKALDKRDRSWQEAGHGIWLQEAASSSRPDIALAKSEQQMPEPTAPKWVLKARVAIDYHNCLEVQNHVPPPKPGCTAGSGSQWVPGFLVSFGGPDREQMVRDDFTGVTRSRCGP